MIRRIFTAASAISLLLLLGMCAMWIRSYWAADELVWNGADQNWSVLLSASRGDVVAARAPYPIGPVVTKRGWLPQHVATPAAGRPAIPPCLGEVLILSAANTWHRFGIFYLDYSIAYADAPWWALRVPIWMLCCLLAVIPTAWTFNRLRKSSHLRAGICHACGYDLRASTERCPECGRAIP